MAISRQETSKCDNTLPLNIQSLSLPYLLCILELKISMGQEWQKEMFYQGCTHVMDWNKSITIVCHKSRKVPKTTCLDPTFVGLRCLLLSSIKVCCLGQNVQIKTLQVQ